MQTIVPKIQSLNRFMCWYMKGHKCAWHLINWMNGVGSLFRAQNEMGQLRRHFLLIKHVSLLEFFY